MGSLFSDSAKIPQVLMTILAFSLSDTFDTIGTFIGTGRQTGIFSAEDEKSLENGSGFSSKMDKALFADATAQFYRCNLWDVKYNNICRVSSRYWCCRTYWLTSVVTAICFLLSSVFLPFYLSYRTLRQHQY